MLRLALRSVRHRPATLTATLIAAFLAATLVMAFASMLDTAGGPGVDDDSNESLATMATIVGGWGVLIAAFAMTSTLGLHLRARASEVRLLRSIGATPGQLRRMLLIEAVGVASVGFLLGILPAMLGGRLLLDLLQDTDQVAVGVGYRFGAVALGTGLAITVVAAVLAALVSTRRRKGASSAERLAFGPARLSKKRIAAGVLFLLLGLDLGVVTATVFRGEGIDAMQTGGQASIWTAIGLAILAPAILRRVSARLAAPLAHRVGVTGHLAVLHLRQQSDALARTLMPIILFVGIAVGTLYLQSIENAQPFASGGGITRAEADNIQTLNLVVVGMIALFAAVMVVNTATAATTDRRSEFARQRLVGLTPPQVGRLVALEGALVTLTGIALGTLAAAFTVIPYSIARTGSVVPDVGPAILIAVALLTAVLTVGSGVLAARSVTRAPAVSDAPVAA